MTSLPIITREVDQSEQQFLVKVTYPVSFYQEIKNVKDFTFETFWSTAGGYLGFFLGYSLLQVPELLQISASYCKNMKLSVLVGLVVAKASERFWALFGRKKTSSNSTISLEEINHSRDEEFHDVLV